MKVLVAVLVVMLIGLQYRVWFGSGSLQEVWRLKQTARNKSAEVLRLRNRNQALAAEVADLKKGLDAIEERARSALGMISADETFYQFVRDHGRDQPGDVAPAIPVMPSTVNAEPTSPTSILTERTDTSDAE